MKRCAVVLLALLALPAGADDAKEKAVKQGLEKLKGKWKLVSVESRGNKWAAKDDSPSYLIFDGDKLTTETPKAPPTAGTGGWTITIDPAATPATLDRAHKAGDPAKPVVEKCIYKLEKDTLTLCSGWTKTPGVTKEGERPKEFKTTAEGGIMWVYQRAVK